MGFTKIVMLYGIELMPIALIVAQFGSFLNEIAAEENGGKMPVLCLWKSMGDSLTNSTKHAIMTAQSKMKVLCDIIPDPYIKQCGLWGTMLSPGDILIKLGLGMGILGVCFLSLPIALSLATGCSTCF